jgi:hypothetical protein
MLIHNTGMRTVSEQQAKFQVLVRSQFRLLYLYEAESNVSQHMMIRVLLLNNWHASERAKNT